MKANKLGFAGVLALSGLIALGSTSFAQTNNPPQRPPAGAGGPGGRGGPRMTPDERLKQLSEVLSLTKDQEAKIKPILEDEAKKMQAVRADTALSQEDRRAKMREIREESSKKIQEVLTPEQKEKYAKMPQPGRGPGRGPVGRPGGGPARGQGTNSVTR